jgi:D-glycero-D-manno-heptose 1,7-bisphosphate phosphatase
MKYTTIFLDRDGVINQKAPEGNYIKSLSEFHFLPGVLEAMDILDGLFKYIVVVTNQRGLVRDIFSYDSMKQIHNYMSMAVKRIDNIYVCPHENWNCNCRKPLPGMALQAKKDFPAIDFDKSIVVGDSLTDLHFAHNIGATGFLIDEDFTLLDFSKWIRSLS